MSEKIIQLGLDLLTHRGGIYQAACDYHSALGGRIFSLLDPAEGALGRDARIEYFKLGNDPFSRLAGRLRLSEQKRLFKEMDASGPLFLHGSFRFSSWYALKHQKQTDQPLIYIPHGSLDPWVFTQRRAIKKLWLSSLGQQLLRKSNYVLAMTQNELKKIQLFAGIRENQRVIHLPLNAANYRATADAATTRLALGIPLEARLLCFLGRLHQMKRPRETIEAIGRTENIHLVIAGPDDSETSDSLQAYAAQLGLAKRVHVVGPQYGDQKYNLLQASDGYISLSHRENFNYTAAEAMAMGLPLILSPGNDLQGELHSVNAGWMLKSCEPSDVDEALTEFAGAVESSLKEMGANGYRWAESQLHPQRIKEELGSLL